MRKCVIFDMDGTLADVRGIRHFVRRPNRDFDSFHAESVNAPANPVVASHARLVKHMGFDVVVVTARKAKWRDHTAWWLAMHNIPSDALIMRATEDQRADVDVKRDILNHWIRPFWQPTLAVDDNPAIIAMWRSEKIPVIEVPGWEV